MKPIEHVLFHPKCLLSHLMCAWKRNKYKGIFILLNTLELLMTVAHQKTQI